MKNFVKKLFKGISHTAESQPQVSFINIIVNYFNYLFIL